MLHFREAELSDWDALWEVRLSVKENVLVNTSAVTFQHYTDMLHAGGKGWVCEVEGKIVGFAILDKVRANIWALFISPAFAQKGIGKRLHHLMLDWAFGNGIEALWLSTDPGTRAEQFYSKAGWERKGLQPDGELRFEMKKSSWIKRNPVQSSN